MKNLKDTLVKTSHLSKILPRVATSSSSPGTIEYIWKERKEEVKISIIDYTQDECIEKDISSIEESLSLQKKSSTKWMNITGIHNEQVIKDIGDKYNIHSLVLWDIVNTTQRPKVEEHDGHIYVIIKMVYFKEKTNEVFVEQVSLLIWDGYLISLQEEKTDVFWNIRDRIRMKKWKICSMRSDYLMYAMLDAIVDQYFIVMEQISEKIELMETELMSSVEQEFSTKFMLSNKN